MGVVYKLKEEVIKYILEERKKNPNLGCRKLASLCTDKFQIKVSKSSINSVIKQAGLSMPVGRRHKKRRHRKQLALPREKLKIKGMLKLAFQPESLLPKEKPEEAIVLPLPEPPREELPKEESIIVLPPPEVPKKELPKEEPPKEEPIKEPVQEAPAEEEVSAEEPVQEAPPASEEAKQEPLQESIEAVEQEPPKEAEPISPEPPIQETPLPQPELPVEPPPPAEIPTEEPKTEEPKVEVPKPEEIEPKPMEPVPEAASAEEPLGDECTGAIFLKGIDYLVGGSESIVHAVIKRLNKLYNNINQKTEGLIYLPLFESQSEEKLSYLWTLLGKRLSLEELDSYLNEIQPVKTLSLDISRLITTTLNEIRGVKVNLADGTSLFLDAQLHTIWSTPHIPYDFSTTIHNMRESINKFFYENNPFVFFMAPGYGTPSKEFFNFLLGLDYNENRVTKLSIYGAKLEELGTFPIEQAKKFNFVFGLWPWQFGQFRSIRNLGQFKPFKFNALKKDLFIADLEFDLTQPTVDKKVTLRGVAIKSNLNEKARIVILTNASSDILKNSEEIVNLYLCQWPNLEESFQDLSRKIELFTYTAGSQRLFSTEHFDLSRGISEDLKMLLKSYLLLLDSYFRLHFLPTGYEDKDFPTAKERFYDLRASLERREENILVTFHSPSGYEHLRDLEYACRRLNERDIIFYEKKRLFFTC